MPEIIGVVILALRINCPICDCAQCQIFHRKQEHALLICEACRRIFWNKAASDDELAISYENADTERHQQRATQDAAVSYYRDHVRELRALVENPRSGLRIADVGCSLPVFLREAKALGAARAIGVEVAKEAREAGPGWGVDILSPNEFLSIADGSLDVLRYSHVLEHLPDPRRVLSEQLSKLRRGGLLYITQPNFPVFEPRETEIEPHDSVWPTHLHFFNPISLLRLCGGRVRVEKFFSVTDEASAFHRYRSLIDIEYAMDQLKSLKDMGEAVRGVLNNWPLYTGLDAAL